MKRSETFYFDSVLTADDVVMEITADEPEFDGADEPRYVTVGLQWRDIELVATLLPEDEADLIGSLREAFKCVRGEFHDFGVEPFEGEGED